jgi:pyruvate dehydrogenase (quinone)
MLGLVGLRVETPAEIGPAWERAFAADRPAVIDARTDPDVPPLPPHITFAQMKAMTSAILRGDPDRRGVVMRTMRETVGGLLPSRR